ncbi:uncharacterized protein LOC113280586 [Papaver somniferum]|uniref:uncharacterized protein LOC113280586 n=1 Tax=Papaver somniferum TaxID=3469 RepID=UPI000E6F6D37|nr:uncharacterized protein LOC113280586 [Papaver somniferum]
MKIWSAEVLVPPPNVFDKPVIPKRHKHLREGAFKSVVGALDDTLISASIPFGKQTPYRGRVRGECFQNVLAICDWDMYFLYVVVGWEGTAHDSRVLTEAVRDPSFKFSLPPPDKYYLCDAAYFHTKGFMCLYRNIRYWIGDYPTEKEEKFNQDHARLRNVIERAFRVLKRYRYYLLSMHNFLRHNALDDRLFKEYENETFDMNETQVEVEVEAETEENAPRLFGRQEQICMTNSRDEIASLL